MTHDELTRLLVKIAGAYVLVWAITEIPAFISYYFMLNLAEESALSFLGVSVIPFILVVMLGIALIYFPGMISSALIKGERDNKSEDNIKTLQLVAFRVLGLYLLFRAVSDLTYHVSSLLLNKKEHNIFNTPDLTLYSNIFATSAEFIFAAILIMGAKNIIQLLEKMRQ